MMKNVEAGRRKAWNVLEGYCVSARRTDVQSSNNGVDKPLNNPKPIYLLDICQSSCSLRRNGLQFILYDFKFEGLITMGFGDRQVNCIVRLRGVCW